jgi:hypothetical protein
MDVCHDQAAYRFAVTIKINPASRVQDHGRVVSDLLRSIEVENKPAKEFQPVGDHGPDLFVEGHRGRAVCIPENLKSAGKRILGGPAEFHDPNGITNGETSNEDIAMARDRPRHPNPTSGARRIQSQVMAVEVNVSVQVKGDCVVDQIRTASGSEGGLVSKDQWTVDGHVVRVTPDHVDAGIGRLGTVTRDGQRVSVQHIIVIEQP